MFIYVHVCFPDTVKSIKLSRKMFVLLSKDDRCRFYILRLLVEGVLQKVKLNSKKKPGQPFFAYDYNSSLSMFVSATLNCKNGVLLLQGLEPKILKAASLRSFLAV